MEVESETGEYSSDINVVLEKWEKDSGSNHSSFHDNFLKDTKPMLEDEMNKDFFGCNLYLNANFTTEEVKTVVDKTKLKKPAGIDEISYEVLKSPRLFRILLELFQFCFDHCIIPVQWYKSIIKPKPKSSRNDPKSPLSYRGKSLIIDVYKLLYILLY